MKKILLLLLLYLLSSCGEDVSTQVMQYDDSKTMGTINFKFLSSQNQLGVDSVKIKQIGGKEYISDKNGEVIFANLQMGTHAFIVKKSGYADIIVNISLLGNATLGSDLPQVPDVSAVIKLKEIGAEVKGKIYYEDSLSNLVPAVGSQAKLSLSNSSVVISDIASYKLLVDTYFADVDANGDFIFYNIPENVGGTITTNDYIVDAKNVYSSSQNMSVPVTVSKGEFIDAGYLSLKEKNTTFFLISKNINNLKESDSLVFTFSEPVNITLLTKNSIKVLEGYSEVLTDGGVWNAEHTTLTVKLLDGFFEAGKDYQIDLDLESMNGSEFSDSYNFSIDNVIGDVSSVTGFELYAINYGSYGKIDTNVVNSSTSKIYLRWNSVKNATKYEIYAKRNSENSYKKVGTETDTLISISTTDWFINNGTAKIMIVALNSESLSSILSAPTLNLSDKIGPSITPSLLSLGRYDSYGSVTLSEDVDTNAIHSGIIADLDSISFKFKWVDTDRFYIIPIYSSSIGDVLTSIDLSVLKDLNGNSISDKVLNVNFSY